MGDSSIITVMSPVNVGIIKYFNGPNVKTIYPMNDYLTVTLDPNATCAKVSVCARQEFKEDEFWLNGERDDKELAFCLNEVKYMAANQHSVSVEFLTRKVHIACENNFLPSSGTSPYTARFNAVMTALCQLYNVKPKSFKNHNLVLDFVKSPSGGFVLKRDMYENKHFKGKLIADGKHWPDLRVLILVVKRPKKETLPEQSEAVVKSSEYMDSRLTESLPENIKAITKAIKDKDFTTFAETSMKDNDQYHSINTDVQPPRAYKTDVSRTIQAVIHVFNQRSGELKASYTFDTGPNASLFFLEKNAREVISLIKYVFPTTKANFIRGLDDHVDLEPEYFKTFPVHPMKKNQIKYAIYSKVGNLSVQLDNRHLLDDNGDLIVKSAEPSPSKDTISSLEYSDALEEPEED